MSSPAPLAPRRGEGLGIVLGLLATCALHVIATVVVVIGAGILSEVRRSGGGDAALAIVLIFWAGIGLWQWLYVAPAALLAKRLGWRATSKGLWIGGAAGTLLSALCYGGMAASSIATRAVPSPSGTSTAGTSSGSPASPGPPEAAPTAGLSRDFKGTVEAFDGRLLKARTEEEGLVKCEVTPSTEYILLKANGGAVHVTSAVVRPGARVVVDAWRNDPHLRYASMVRVVEESRPTP